MSFLDTVKDPFDLVQILLDALGVYDGSIGDKFDKTYIAGYENYLGVHVGVCHGPVDRVTGIKFDGRYGWKGVAEPGVATVNAEGFDLPLPQQQEGGTGPYVDVPNLIVVNQGYLFGGEEQEGGVMGIIDVLHGDTEQTSVQTGRPAQGFNKYLQTKLQPRDGSAYQPAYRGILSLVFRSTISSSNEYLTSIWVDIFGIPGASDFRTNKLTEPTTYHTGFYWGAMSTRMRNVEVEGFRALEGWHTAAGCWYPEKCIVVHDDDTESMNAIHIIYQALADQRSGMRVPLDLIDDTSFRACADTCFAEGFGLDIVWDGSSTIDEFIGEICRYVDGTVYLDPSTGKFKMYLLRKLTQEQIDALPVFSLRQIEDIGSQSIPLGEELVNHLSLIYTNPKNGETETISDSNTALISIYGVTIPDTISFPGIWNKKLAAAVLARELRSRTSGAAMYRGQRLTRLVPEFGTSEMAAFTLFDGAPFKLYIPEHGVNQQVYRAVNVQYQTLSDNGISYDAIEDVPSMEISPYVTGTPGTGWTDDRKIPPQFLDENIRLIDLPYLTAYALIGSNGLRLLPPDAAFFAVLVAPVEDIADSVVLHTNTLGGVPDPTYTADPAIRIGPVGALCPTSQLDGALAYESGGALVTTCKIKNLRKLSPYAMSGAWFIVDDEKILCTSANVSEEDPDYLTLTLWRGILDTVPANHADEALMWWFNNSTGCVYIGTKFIAGDDPYLFVQAKSIVGGAPLGADTPVIHTDLHNAWFAPYPPANVKIDNTYFNTNPMKSFVIEWACRNRITQSNVYLAWDAPGTAPEAGTTYTLEVYDADTDALINRITEIPAYGSSGYYRYTGGDGGAANYRIEFFAVRDGLESPQRFVQSGKVSGYGLNYGNNWGGSKLGIVVPPGEFAPLMPASDTVPCPRPVFVAGRWWHLDPTVSGDGLLGYTDRPGEILDYYGSDTEDKMILDSISTGNDTPWKARLMCTAGDGDTALLVASDGTDIWSKLAGANWQLHAVTFSGLTATPATINSIFYTGSVFVICLNDGADIYTCTDLAGSLTRTNAADTENDISEELQVNWIGKIGSNYIATGFILDDSTKVGIFSSTDLSAWTSRNTNAPLSALNGNDWAYWPPDSNWWVFETKGNKLDGAVRARKTTNGWTWSKVATKAGANTPPFGAPFVIKTGASTYKMQTFAGPYILSTTNGTTFTKTRCQYSPEQALLIANSGGLPFYDNAIPGNGTGLNQYGALARTGPYAADDTLPVAFRGNYVKAKLLGFQGFEDAFVADTYPVPVLPAGAPYSNIVGCLGDWTGALSDGGFQNNGTLKDVYGFIGMSTGKKYFEIQVGSSVSDLFVGVVAMVAPLEKRLITSAILSSAGDVLQTARINCPGGASIGEAAANLSLPRFGGGSVFGIKLDTAERTCEILLDGVSIVTINNLDLNMVWFPVFTASNTVLRANLGQRAFSFAVPSGYTAWLGALV